MEAGMEQKTLTTEQVAERLQVRPRTVSGWCREGYIKHVWLPGGRYRIPESELQRLVRYPR